MNESLHISDAGLALEQRYEKGPRATSPNGFAPRAYKCPAGKWTIGWGHVIKSAGDYMLTCVIDAITADKLLRQDNIDAENAVRRLVKVPLSQNEFDALVCLVFNIGETNFANSTLLKKLNAGDKRGAADEFPKWNKVRDPITKALEIADGLVTRRADERALFLGDIHV